MSRPARASTLQDDEHVLSSRVALALLLAAAVLHVAIAGVPDIFDELPGQYAGTAWEIVQSGNWLVPTLDGVPRLQKPPLVYWFTAVSLSLFGRSEFAARRADVPDPEASSTPPRRQRAPTGTTTPDAGPRAGQVARARNRGGNAYQTGGRAVRLTRLSQRYPGN